MKKEILILFIPLILSCSKNSKLYESYNSHLIRIDSLITIQNKRLLLEFTREDAYNPDLTEKTDIKITDAYALINEIENTLKSDFLTNNNVTLSIYLLSFYPEFDKLEFDIKFINDLKTKYFQYWIDKNLQNPVNKDDALSIIIDVKMFLNEVLSRLLYNLRENDFNFNELHPIVIEKSNKVKVGETYEAKICFIAFDSTRNIGVEVNNKKLSIEDGYGVYRFRSNKPGKQTIKGVISFPRNNWEFVKFPFEHSFIITDF